VVEVLHEADLTKNPERVGEIVEGIWDLLDSNFLSRGRVLGRNDNAIRLQKRSIDRNERLQRATMEKANSEAEE
jgi:hypothetical protein